MINTSTILTVLIDADDNTWVRPSLTSWFPWGPQEAYCNAAFCPSGGLSSSRSLKHTQKLKHKPSIREHSPLWSHPRSIQALPLRELLHCENKGARCREGKWNRERGWFMQECNISFSIFLATIFFFISLGQANIFLQGILGQYCRSSRNPFQNNSLEFQGITHSYQRVFFPRDNAEYDSQAVKSEVQYKPYRAWKEHWQMNGRLKETWNTDSNETRFGESFFFFFQSAGLLALVTLMPSAAHALAVMIPPTH